jgi:hypothetical protein
MTDELKYLKDEAEDAIDEAYRLGFEQGVKPNKSILDSKRDMLINFDAYISKFRRLQDDDGELIFVTKGYEPTTAITLPTLITNFLLSYDDE